MVRLPVDEQHVGELPRRQRADVGAVARRRPTGVAGHAEQRVVVVHPEQIDEQLELAGVPLAVRRDRESRLGPGDQRGAVGDGLGQDRHGSVELATHPVERGRRRRVATLEEVDEQGHRRNQRDVPLDDLLQRRPVHVRGVHDPVEPGLGGVGHGLSRPGVDGDGVAEPVGFGHGRDQLVQSERAVLLFARSRPGDLDQIDAVLHLVADLLDDVVDAADEHAERRRQRPDPARQRVADPLLARDLAPRCGQARTFDESRLDGVAHGDGDALRAAGVACRGDPGAQDAAGVDGRSDRPICRGGVDRQLFLAARLAEADVHVGIDEAGHDRQAGRVGRRRAGVLGGHLVGRADPGDPVTVEDDRAAIDHGPVGTRQDPPAVDASKILRRHVASGTIGKYGPPIGSPRCRPSSSSV